MANESSTGIADNPSTAKPPRKIITFKRIILHQPSNIAVDGVFTVTVNSLENSLEGQGKYIAPGNQVVVQGDGLNSFDHISLLVQTSAGERIESLSKVFNRPKVGEFKKNSIVFPMPDFGEMVEDNAIFRVILFAADNLQKLRPVIISHNLRYSSNNNKKYAKELAIEDRLLKAKEEENQKNDAKFLRQVGIAGTATITAEQQEQEKALHAEAVKKDTETKIALQKEKKETEEKEVADKKEKKKQKELNEKEQEKEEIEEQERRDEEDYEADVEEAGEQNLEIVAQTENGDVVVTEVEGEVTPEASATQEKKDGKIPSPEALALLQTTLLAATTAQGVIPSAKVVTEALEGVQRVTTTAEGALGASGGAVANSTTSRVQTGGTIETTSSVSGTLETSGSTKTNTKIEGNSTQSTKSQSQTSRKVSSDGSSEIEINQKAGGAAPSATIEASGENKKQTQETEKEIPGAPATQGTETIGEGESETPGQKEKMETTITSGGAGAPKNKPQETSASAPKLSVSGQTPDAEIPQSNSSAKPGATTMQGTQQQKQKPTGTGGKPSKIDEVVAPSANAAGLQINVIGNPGQAGAKNIEIEENVSSQANINQQAPELNYNPEQVSPTSTTAEPGQKTQKRLRPINPELEKLKQLLDKKTSQLPKQPGRGGESQLSGRTSPKGEVTARTLPGSSVPGQGRSTDGILAGAKLPSGISAQDIEKKGDPKANSANDKVGQQKQSDAPSTSAPLPPIPKPINTNHAQTSANAAPAEQAAAEQQTQEIQEAAEEAEQSPILVPPKAEARPSSKAILDMAQKIPIVAPYLGTIRMGIRWLGENEDEIAEAIWPKNQAVFNPASIKIFELARISARVSFKIIALGFVAVFGAIAIAVTLWLMVFLISACNSSIVEKRIIAGALGEYTGVLSGKSSVCNALSFGSGSSFSFGGGSSGGGGASDSFGGTGNGKCQLVKSGPASAASLQSSCFGANAGNASMVSMAESGGDPLRPSGVDKCADGNVVSWGLFQINITAHKMGALNCPAAFTGLYNGPGSSCRVKPDQIILYNQCVNAAKDADQNIAAACIISGNGSNWNAWKNTANKCGF